MSIDAAITIKARYSVHNLRQAFAARLYEATHDVYQVEKALGHATVAVTETYFRSLGLVGGCRDSHGKDSARSLYARRGEGLGNYCSRYPHHSPRKVVQPEEAAEAHE
jgi:integrase